MKCKRCGGCCKNMALEISPKELKKSFMYWDDKKKNPKHFIYKDIHLAYPMLIYLGYDRKIKRYRYRCKHLEFKKGKAICTIHDIKPDVCSCYGEDEKMNMGSRVAKQTNLYPNCVF